MSNRIRRSIEPFFVFDANGKSYYITGTQEFIVTENARSNGPTEMPSFRTIRADDVYPAEELKDGVFKITTPDGLLRATRDGWDPLAGTI